MVQKESIADFVTAMAGTGLTATSGVLSLSVSGEVINMGNDSLVFVDASDSNNIKSESVSDFVVVAGTGLTEESGQLSLDSNSITSILNTSLTKIGTATNQEYIKFDTGNEVNTFINNSAVFSVTASGIDVTGAATVSSTLAVTGDTTLTGDLTVSGGDITPGNGQIVQLHLLLHLQIHPVLISL